MPEAPTRLYRLIEERLDGTLADFVNDRRPGKGWRPIAAELEASTGIPVSNEILRKWFTEPGVTSPAPGNGERAA